MPVDVIDPFDRSLTLAREHAAWAFSHCQTPAMMCEGFGIALPVGAPPTWEEVIAGLARQWRELWQLGLVNYG